jgi:hypothetical protein
VTGPVLEVTGSTVTIEYTMSAKNIESKGGTTKTK